MAPGQGGMDAAGGHCRGKEGQRASLQPWTPPGGTACEVSHGRSLRAVLGRAQ